MEEVEGSDEDPDGSMRSLVTRVGSVEYTEAVEAARSSRESSATVLKPMGRSHRTLQLSPTSTSFENPAEDSGRHPNAGWYKKTRSFLYEPVFPGELKLQPSSKSSAMTKSVRTNLDKPVSSRSDESVSFETKKPDRTRSLTRSIRTFLAKPITARTDESKSFEKDPLEPDKAKLLVKAVRAFLSNPDEARSDKPEPELLESKPESLESPNPRPSVKSLRTFLANPVLVGPVKPVIQKPGSHPYRALVNFEAKNEEDDVHFHDGKNIFLKLGEAEIECEQA